MVRYELSGDNECIDMSYDMSDAIRFSPISRSENKRWTVRNHYFKGCFEETRNNRFNIVHSSIYSANDCSLRTKHDGGSFLSLGIVQRGSVEFIQSGKRYTWQRQEANILVGSDYHDEYNFFRGGKTFEMLNLVISVPFLRSLAERYPAYFEDVYLRQERGETFIFSPRNQLVSPLLQECVQSITQARMLGNFSEMYLESKIQEALSLFIGDLDMPLSRKERDSVIKEKIFLAKEILTQEYLSPPSLHELALRVGTNECTLKTEFKKYFKQTAFSFLFDYRMRLASSYLLDTDKSIAEIAELTGYEHPSHFCIAFKRKFGVTALAFRKISKTKNKERGGEYFLTPEK